ncbi:MAG: tRNA pseudouridine(38-40) synthase TruA [Phycisphaerales bacterium]|nr:tRNA pseudouridine(38-40) synthase TruA [Phycisphaerae bacterium]NNF44986.1 tRNA pseudouridine(38-40) synthase TruA [Phycisphaerales bacterium]NNM27764.1 tRNA pseudouridine(38-40) synthase TruA [Phycisphaerales bacterium]
MPRYRLTVAYEGTAFHGWQKQHPPDAEPLRTVQGVLEETVRQVVREPIAVLGASRTDAGVHAWGQVAAFTTTRALPPRGLVRGLNARLPDDVLVRGAVVVDEAFNPISDAVRKAYRYRIAHGGAGGVLRPLFDRRTVTFAPSPLDPVSMNIAAQHLVGTHDFTSFTRLHHGRESTVRTVDACTVLATGPDRLRIDVSGNGFLYNMVRIIAGTLMQVGRGHWTPDVIPAVLAAADRVAAGPTLPPEGLRLEWIEYPPDTGTACPPS